MAMEFASAGDVEEQTVSFTETGSDEVLVIDTQARPKAAEDVVSRMRQVTDKPIKKVHA